MTARGDSQMIMDDALIMMEEGDEARCSDDVMRSSDDGVSFINVDISHQRGQKIERAFEGENGGEKS